MSKVFFSELKYTYTESTVSYNVLALMCDVGGALGLILGSTVLTFFEFADLVLTLVLTSIDRRVKNKAKQKTQRTTSVTPIISVDDVELG